MRYEIVLDKTKRISQIIQDSLVYNAKVSFEANKAGKLTFTMLPGNPYYYDVVIHNTVADLYINGVFRFRGIASSESKDFYGRKTVQFDGMLSVLNESIQRPARYVDYTLYNCLSAYITNHNAEMNGADAIPRTISSVVVDGFSTVGTVYRYTNYISTLDEIMEDFVENFGGYIYLSVTPDTDDMMLVYSEGPRRVSDQVIQIGSNLLDLVRQTETTDVCTCLIPIGAELGTETVPGIKDHVTISSVNGGLDYIIGNAAAAWYGYVWRVVKWDNVTTPAKLLTRAQDYIQTAQWAIESIDASAVDLGIAEGIVDQFEILDSIRVVSTPHAIDKYFTLTKLEIDLDHPGNSQITLGDSGIVKLSDQVANTTRKVEK